MILKGGTIASLFLYLIFLFFGCPRGDRLRHQGDLAPRWIVPLL